MNAEQLKKINARLDKIEKQHLQELLSLLEIMSNVTFFGEMKKTNCEYSKENQCSFFFLKKEAKNKLPMATDCKIKDCRDTPNHCHLELSNLTCTLCPLWRNSHHLNSMPTTHEVEKQIQTE